MTELSISLIIPVYNRPEMIAECLASLAPSLGTLTEVIVVDDGSTDGKTPQATKEAITRLDADGKVRLIEQTNAGPGAARNTGAQAAKGEWLAFLDSDDLWFPWTGQSLQAALARHPEVLVLFMNVKPFEERRALEGWTDTESEDLLYETFFDLARTKPRPALLGAGYFAVRRQDFMAHDGFVAALRGAEDTDLFFRMAADGRFLAVKHPVFVGQRFSNADSLTRNMDAVYEGVVFLLRGHRADRYSKPDRAAPEGALADILAFWLHSIFWQGYGKEAYTVLLREGGLGLLLRNGHRTKALKLLFIPVLALLRPQNHRFRWRPRTT